LLLLPLLAACQAPARPPGFSLDRGAQLLAAGSPKSAIPFLTQTVAGVPDGPDPVALLSLAYALDLQPDRAILQAQRVRRPAGAPLSWEAVAVGIAHMTENRPTQAITAFQCVGSHTPAAVSARQWCALSQILAGQRDNAVATLEGMATEPALCTSATLWITLIHEQSGQKDLAATALRRCAQTVVTTSGEMALTNNLAGADGQTLYDAGLAALASGDFIKANNLLSRVHERTADDFDTPVWLALISGVTDDWQTCRNRLHAACDTGSTVGRGLACQLVSVICALEDRPTAIVQYTLLGQRMMGRTGEPAYIHEQAQPEPVWGADNMR
jgi:hypothetical protein